MSASASPETVGADFRRLRAAYLASTVGSAVAHGALPIVAVLTLGAGAFAVTVLTALPVVVTGLIGLSLGPMIEGRLKRPVMIAADLVRFGALLTVPVAGAMGWLSLTQLVVVSSIVGVAQIAFVAASGANLRALVGPRDLLRANASLEQINWTSLLVGPPVGGALIAVIGPVATVLIDALSYLASAAWVRRLRSSEPSPIVPERVHPVTDAVAGLRYLWQIPLLRSLLLNSLLFSGGLGIVVALEVPFALETLGMTTWQFGLVMGLCSLGGLIGSRLSGRLVERFGSRRVLLAAGVARTPFAALLALLPMHGAGVVLWILLDGALLFAAGIFNPTFATTRMLATADRFMARVVTTWTVLRSFTQPLFMIGGGWIASVVGIRPAIAIGGLIAVATCAFLPWSVPEVAPAEHG